MIRSEPMHKTLETGRAPADGDQWSSPRGELTLWTPSPSTLVIRLRGHGIAEFADLIVARFDRLAEHGVHSTLFFDTEHLESYDSSLRTVLTDRFRVSRPDRAHVMSMSKLVQMGIAVASLVLGDLIQPHKNRRTFTAALEANLGSGSAEDFIARAGLDKGTPWSRPGAD